LARRREPYWTVLVPGGALGYRRGARGGTWIARWRDQAGKQRYRALGPADDRDEADDGRSLSFERASGAARAWFTEVGASGASGERTRADDPPFDTGPCNLHGEADRPGAEHHRHFDLGRKALGLWEAATAAVRSMPAEMTTPEVLEATRAFLVACARAVRLVDRELAARVDRLADRASPDPSGGADAEEPLWFKAVWCRTGNLVAAYRALHCAEACGASAPTWAIAEVLARAREVGRLAQDQAIDPNEALRAAIEALGLRKGRRNKIRDDRQDEDDLIQAADHEHEIRSACKHGRTHKGELNFGEIATRLGDVGRKGSAGARLGAGRKVTARTRDRWRQELAQQMALLEALTSERRK
jgi:hypothetical protein